MVKIGFELLSVGINDKGNPDSFIGSIIAEGDLPWTHFEKYSTFSVNSGSLSEEPRKGALRCSVREHIQKGAFYVHGLKTEEELNFIRSCL